MLNIQEKNLMLKFLQRNFPTHRLKHNAKFKRTIILDNGETFHLNDKSKSKTLYHKLSKILNVVFDSNDLTNDIVLKDFLNLK